MRTAKPVGYNAANSKKELFTENFKKLQGLKEENGFLASVLQDLQVDQQKYEGRIFALQQAKQEAISKLDSERDRADNFAQHVEQLIAEKHKLQSHAKRRMKQMQQLRLQSEELQEAIIEIKEEADGYVRAARVAKAEAAELRECLRLSKSELQSSLALRNSAAENFRELEEQQVRSNAENQQLRGRVAALEGALAAAEAAAAQETRAAHGELGPNEREAAARERAEKELLQRELAGLLDELQQQRTALSSAQHQLAHWKRMSEQLDRQLGTQTEAAAIVKENECCARSHAQLATTWVQRLRAEIVEAGEAAVQMQAAKAALVQDKMALACALQRSTEDLAGLRVVVETQGEENGHQATGVPQRQKEIAGALVGEQKILEKLELEIRRVLVLERLRLSDLREMHSLQERLDAEAATAWALREQLAEQRFQGTNVPDSAE